MNEINIGKAEMSEVLGKDVIWSGKIFWLLQL